MMNETILLNVIQYILYAGYTEISVYSAELKDRNGQSLKYFCFSCYEPTEDEKRSIRLFF